MPILAIENATALVGRERRGDQMLETQLIELDGRSSVGGPGHACLIFSRAVDPARTLAVGYVTEADGVVSVVGWLPEAAYGEYRHHLCAGGALGLRFEMRDRSSGYLRRIALARGTSTLVATGAGSGRGMGQSGRRPEIDFAMPL
jgi:hypothetical protein